MTMTRTTRRLATALFSASLLAGLAVSGATAAPPAGHGRAFAEVRAATARFASLKQAANAGYGLPPAPAPLHECISSFDNTGAMGFHYINGSLLDTTVDPREPEALVYAPDADGTLHLVALEYVVFQAPWIAEHGSEMPSLFGEMFMATGEPNRFDIPAFFSLHLWLYQDNPAGLFTPFNPTVSCAGAQTASAARAVAQVTTATAPSGTLAFACSIARAESRSTSRPT
jgi:hypothetical protein